MEKEVFDVKKFLSKKIQIKYLVSDNQVFFYTGFILQEEPNFIYFNDEREGILRLNQDRILLIKEVK